MKTNKEITAKQLRAATEEIYNNASTLDKLEIIEACQNISDKMNLNLEDLKMHELFLISYNVQKSILKSLDEIANTREFYNNHKIK